MIAALIVAVVVLLVLNVVLALHLWRALLSAELYRDERNRYRDLARRGVSEMAAAITSAAAKQV